MQLGGLQVDPNGPSPLEQEMSARGMAPPETMAPTNTYWAAQAPEQVIAEIRNKERMYFDFAERRGFIKMWRHMTAQYYGQDPVSGEWVTQVVGIDGPQGEVVRFRVNETRSFMKQLITMAIGTRPAFECSATNDDYDSIGQAETADSIVSYIYQEQYGERKERRTVERAMLVGVGWSWCQWDQDGGDLVDVPATDPLTGQPPMRLLPDGTQAPVLDPSTGQPPTIQVRSGNVTLSSLGPWDVVSETSIEEEQDHLWRVVRQRRGRHEIAGKYQDQRDKILNAQGLDNYVLERLITTLSSTDLVRSDEIVVKHFYHAPSPAMVGTQYEEGRYICFVDDTVLYDGPLPYNMIPLIALCPAEFLGTSFGYSDAWDMCSLNQMQDQVISDVASNLSTYGRQCISVEEGSDVSADDLANGFKIITRRPNTQPPVAIQLAAIPQGAQWFLDLVTKKYQSISALNSVARGDPEANITSGQMAALFHSIAIEANSAMQLAVDTHRERVANLILDILKQYANAPMVVRMAGADERPYLDTFTKDKLTGIRGVTIKTSNPMMRTQAGRLQLAEFAMKIPGAIQDPAQISEIFVSGQVKPLYDSPRKRRMRIKLEDELLLQNPQVQTVTPPPNPPLPNGMVQPPPQPYDVVVGVPVHNLDDHEKHINQHYALLASREVLANQELWKVVNTHIQHHIKVWKETDPNLLGSLGIKPFPQPPPMAAPAGPGPGGAPANAGVPGVPHVGPPGQPANDNGHVPEGMQPGNQPWQQSQNHGVKLPTPPQSPVPGNTPQ